MANDAFPFKLSHEKTLTFCLSSMISDCTSFEDRSAFKGSPVMSLPVSKKAKRSKRVN